MTLLAPLGLLALISIIVLIVIYIIKPNYQQKFISTTYVWKLSLKYKKRSLPSSRLREIILIICQVLILTCCAFILARPVKNATAENAGDEVVVVLDASASMRAKTELETRFDRGVTAANQLCTDALRNGSKATLILAGNTSRTVFSRISTTEECAAFFDTVTTENSCTYEEADYDAAMTAAKDVTLLNPSARVYLITDETFVGKPDAVDVVNVSKEGEWNAAIIDAEARIENGYYAFYLKIGCYGKTTAIKVNFDITGVNPTDTNPDGESTIGGNNKLEATLDCVSGKEYTLVFYSNGEDSDNYDTDPSINKYCYTFAESGWNVSVSNFESAYFSIEADDCIDYDNYFNVNGKKNALKVQYYSTERTRFIESTLNVARSYFDDLWDFNVESVAPESTPADSGFDFYIYENFVPEQIPSDGVVFFFNPTYAYSERLRKQGVTVVSDENLSVLTNLEVASPTHPVMKLLLAGTESIGVTRYSKLSVGEDFDVLFSYNGSPVAVSKKEGETRIFVLGISIANSDVAISPGLVLTFLGAIDYFLPATLQKTQYEVGEVCSVNCRGEKVSVAIADKSEEYTEFPADITFETPGAYVVTTQLFGNNKRETDEVFVTVSANEKNIFHSTDRLASPYDDMDNNSLYTDLLTIVAAVLTGLIFAEWILNLMQSA